MTSEPAPIVVPLDGSKVAENAIPHAAFLARLYDNCPVHFLHVADPDTVKTPSDLASAREAFAGYASGLAEQHGIKSPVYHVAEGGAAEAILRYKWENGARFVVIATHGRGGVHAMFVGSVADKVCRAARVPVLAIPGIELQVSPGAGPVLVALDGSPEAERGLALAREIAGKTGALLYLLRAYSVPPPVGVEFSYYSPELLDSFEASARDYLHSVAAPGERTVVVQASAAIAIQEAAEKYEAGMVVVTPRGKGFAQRVALGSTTDRLLHSLERPLLIVPTDQS